NALLCAAFAAIVYAASAVLVRELLFPFPRVEELWRWSSFGVGLSLGFGPAALVRDVATRRRFSGTRARAVLLVVAPGGGVLSRFSDVPWQLVHLWRSDSVPLLEPWKAFASVNVSVVPSGYEEELQAIAGAFMPTLLALLRLRRVPLAGQSLVLVVAGGLGT